MFVFSCGRFLAALSPQREPSAALSSGELQLPEFPELLEEIELPELPDEVELLKLLYELLVKVLPELPERMGRSEEAHKRVKSKVEPFCCSM